MKLDLRCLVKFNDVMIERFTQLQRGMQLLIVATIFIVPSILFWITRNSIIELFAIVHEEYQYEIFPSEYPIYILDNSQINIFSNVDSNDSSLTLNPSAVAYKVTSFNDWTKIDVYGWVWSESVTRKDNGYNLSENLKSENLRTYPNGQILGIILPNTFLQPLAESKSKKWILCKLTGWAKTNLLTVAEPNQSIFGRKYIVTDTMGVEEVPYKRRSVVTLSESAFMFIMLLSSVLSFIASVCFRLIKGGKFFGRDVHQIHTGGGDNVFGNKNSSNEVNDDGRI